MLPGDHWCRLREVTEECSHCDPAMLNLRVTQVTDRFLIANIPKVEVQTSQWIPETKRRPKIIGIGFCKSSHIFFSRFHLRDIVAGKRWVHEKETEVSFEWDHVIPFVLRNEPGDQWDGARYLDSDRMLKMPSMAIRPLLISTWRPRTLSLFSSNQLNGSKRLNMSSLRFPLMGG